MTGQWGFKDGMSPAKVVTVVLSYVMAGAGSGWGGGLGCVCVKKKGGGGQE